MFIIFFSIMRRPLRSTRFPYTTLFRSARWLRLGWWRQRIVELGSAGGVLGRLPGAEGQEPAPAQAEPGPRPGARADRLDRKSTRLNSSHQIISYAVFCLKKKITK